MSDKSELNPLYTIPVEVLNLSEKTLQIIKSMGCPSIGDCVHYFQMIESGIATMDSPVDFIKAMHNEVKLKLAEHGYGTFE